MALTLTPAAMQASTASIPSGVAGILIMTFGRLRAAKRRLASETVLSRSEASRGLTSRLT